MFYNVRHAHRSDYGDLNEKKRIKKFFDPPLSKIGEHQSFSIGESIINKTGREKEYMFIVSPYQRCLKTAELIICGMNKHFTKIHKNQIFVEDTVKESLIEGNGNNLDNFKEIEFFENKIIAVEFVHNKLDFLKEFRDTNIYPETWKDVKNRVNYTLERVKQFSLENPHIIPIVVSHGFFTESIHEDIHGNLPLLYNWGSVNRFYFCENQKDWILADLDGKYH